MDTNAHLTGRSKLSEPIVRRATSGPEFGWRTRLFRLKGLIGPVSREGPYRRPISGAKGIRTLFFVCGLPRRADAASHALCPAPCAALFSFFLLCSLSVACTLAFGKKKEDAGTERVKRSFV